MDLISVIISTYNEPVEWVKKALSSIIDQTYSNLEIIVVADNPNNLPVLEYLRQVSLQKNILLLENERNLGLVKSLNIALEHCTGDYIARMDADDISLPDRLEKQLQYLIRKKLDIVGTGFCDFIDEKKEIPRINPKTPAACNRILKFRNCTLHPSWLMKRNVYEVLNGYREIRACEDYDFLVRASISNFRIGNVPEMLVLYRNNPQSISHQNLGVQKAIMERIAKEYRRNRVLSIDEYETYLKGKDIINDSKEIMDYYQVEEKLCSVGLVKRVLSIGKQMILSNTYRREKLRNQYVKCMFIVDRMMG